MIYLNTYCFAPSLERCNSSCAALERCFVGNLFNPSQHYLFRLDWIFQLQFTCPLTFKILTLILFNDCRTFLLMLALRSWFLIKWYPLVDSVLYYYHFSALQRNDIFRRDQPTPFSRCTGVTIQADNTQTVRKSLTTCLSSTNCSCAHLHWLFPNQKVLFTA